MKDDKSHIPFWGDGDNPVAMNAMTTCAINKDLKFGKLKAGAGNLQLSVTLNCSATNGTSLYDQTVTVKLPAVNFTVKK